MRRKTGSLPDRQSLASTDWQHVNDKSARKIDRTEEVTTKLHLILEGSIEKPTIELNDKSRNSNIGGKDNTSHIDVTTIEEMTRIGTSGDVEKTRTIVVDRIMRAEDEAILAFEKEEKIVEDETRADGETIVGVEIENLALACHRLQQFRL